MHFQIVTPEVFVRSNDYTVHFWPVVLCTTRVGARIAHFEPVMLCTFTLPPTLSTPTPIAVLLCAELQPPFYPALTVALLAIKMQSASMPDQNL